MLIIPNLFITGISHQSIFKLIPSPIILIKTLSIYLHSPPVIITVSQTKKGKIKRKNPLAKNSTLSILNQNYLLKPLMDVLPASTKIYYPNPITKIKSLKIIKIFSKTERKLKNNRLQINKNNIF